MVSVPLCRFLNWNPEFVNHMTFEPICGNWLFGKFRVGYGPNCFIRLASSWILFICDNFVPKQLVTTHGPSRNDCVIGRLSPLCEGVVVIIAPVDSPHLGLCQPFKPPYHFLVRTRLNSVRR